MAKFEVVSKYNPDEINLPVRKTADSAGYDIEAAEDVIIPSYHSQMHKLEVEAWQSGNSVFTLDEMKNLTAVAKARPSLVPTGVKVKLDPGTYMNIAIRSSSPLKYWLILANSQGVIDSDYYNNADNEGEVFIQLINLSPFPIKIKKGEPIAQCIILPYNKVEDDAASGARTGGFGSTTK